MSGLLHLKDQQPVAQGRMRLVYEYPGDPARLIKVIRPDAIDERWGTGQKWYKARRRYRQYISYMREIGEYVAMWARYGRALPFVQKTVGLIETDMGLGLVLEAVRDREGCLAPSLSTLISRRQFDAEAEGALETFIDEVMKSDVVVADLHPGNIVYSFTEGIGHHFVMIDGLGLSTIIPFKIISQSLNRRSKLRHIERMRKRISNQKRDAEIRAAKGSRG